MTLHPLAQYIEHTQLTESSPAALQKLCQEAEMYGFCGVCVRPEVVSQVQAYLSSTKSAIRIVTVLGFPAGKMPLAAEKEALTVGDVPTDVKRQEAESALVAGAQELDLVLNVRQFLQEFQIQDMEQRFTKTLAEFRTIREAIQAHSSHTGMSALLKVILETDLLTAEQIETATRLCVEAGVDFIKTSTGMLMGGQGATSENIRRIRLALEQMGHYPAIGIKASGGVRDAEGARALIEAGATRLGTSNGPAILDNQTAVLGY